MRIPLSTYRLQFGRDLGFQKARELVPYLHSLGITDVYASPLFQAHSDSSSGYDIVDPTRLSDALGSWEDFVAFCKELRRLDMGLVLDIVPNHMSANSSNLWWKDVLENGPSSPYANYFDIEWDPPSRSRGGKMSWPILGAPYADVLERRELTLAFSEDGFSIRYFDRVLPLEPSTYALILENIPEAQKLLEMVRGLPPSSTTTAVNVEERRTEIVDLKWQLWSAYRSDDGFHAHLDETMRAFNGEPGDPRSFDRLDELLGQQPYVLSFWRVAREKVNYRRFFDIADLVGINVEERDVFESTHRLIFRLVDDGLVNGLRIDHIDGLYDPSEYLRLLRERLPDCFIVVEKILERSETLCPEWPVAGTTGYDFLNAAGSVMLNDAGLAKLTETYARLTGSETTLEDALYRQRKVVIESLFAGEAHSLSLHLTLMAESDRYAKDASPYELREALVETTACMPVYRTYTRSFQIRPQDLDSIDEALREAKRRNPRLGDVAWSFVRRVLLLEIPSSVSAEERAGWKQFVQRWQQFSGPVMAKGKEDTFFYIYNRLISMNEVGGQDKPWSVAEFHRFAEIRSKCWPHTLNAGTTHDTKRGEDMRARIHALTEIADLWTQTVKRWQRWNVRAKRVLNGEAVPAANEEYFIYQTLLGAWPLGGDDGTFLERVQNTFLKSWREAKVHTSWSDPNTEYEKAVAEFVATILTPAAENHFLEDFLKFAQHIAEAGARLSLSQTLLRLASPGIPDIYNGAEFWELSMVDPDNRRPVDFARREALLASLKSRSVADLLQNWQCGAVKQHIIQQTLELRRSNAEVFRSGEYVPLQTSGPRESDVIAFARHSGMTWIVAAVPRVASKNSRTVGLSMGKRAFADVELSFPETAPRRWSNLFTGATIDVSQTGRIAANVLFGGFPVALLAALPDSQQ